MNEISRFKKSFFLGRLVWVIGRPGISKIKKVKGLLRSCQIANPEILAVDVHQFIDMLTRGLDEALLSEKEVVLVHDFENIEASVVPLFLKSIGVFRELQMGLSLRLVLVSNRHVPKELDGFARFNAVQISLIHHNSEPGDASARVQALIKKAKRMLHLSGLRVTSRALAFLVYYAGTATDLDLMELIILGIHRSNRKVLRFNHFLPGFFQDDDKNAAQNHLEI